MHISEMCENRKAFDTSGIYFLNCRRGSCGCPAEDRIIFLAYLICHKVAEIFSSNRFSAEFYGVGINPIPANYS